jgi:antitoxin component YwqK of YwqJK toxin-antitoxin module
VALVATLVGAGKPLQGGGPLVGPDAHARVKPPEVRRPEPLASFRGFDPAHLALYEQQLSAAEREAFLGLSRQLFASPELEAFRGIAGLLDAARRQSAASETSEPPHPLVRYELAGEPTPLLGTRRSPEGPITPLPRLAPERDVIEADAAHRATRPARDEESQALVVLDTDADESADAESFDFRLEHPERICTANLSQAFNPNGAGLFPLELLPLPSAGDPRLMRALAAIEAFPSPIPRGDSGDRDGFAGEEPLASAEGGTLGDSLGDTLLQGISEDHSTVTLAFLGVREMPAKTFLDALVAEEDAKSATARALRLLGNVMSRLGEHRKACERGGGAFVEARRTRQGEVNVFSCATPGGGRRGLGIRLVSDGGDRIAAYAISLQDPATRLGVELSVDAASAAIELAGLHGEEYFGPLLAFDGGGHPLALGLSPRQGQGQAGGGSRYDVYEWHETGTLKLHGHRIDGRPTGDERLWYASGTLASEASFDGLGRLAAYRAWHASTIPAEMTAFQEGRIHGLRRWWHPSGTVAGLLNFERGAANGKLTLWYDGGDAGVVGRYRAGRLDGMLTWRYPDGKTLFSGDFKGDRPDGAHRLALPSGVVISEKRFTAGEPSGAWLAFDETGRPLREIGFKAGVKHGRAVVRHEGGKPAIEMVFDSGRIDGTLKSYHEDGTLAARCVYDDDRLVEFTRHHVSGAVALQGKVLSYELGEARFRGLRVDGSPYIDCELRGFELASCQLFDRSGGPVALPSERELTGKLQQADEDASGRSQPLAWKPERCGGARARYNFDQVIDEQEGAIAVHLDTREPCADPALGENLYCGLVVEDGNVQAEPCVISREDAGLDEALREAIAH